MGIKGLLPFVAQASRRGEIAEFKGKTIAVDVSCFLHRSFTGCVFEVAQGQRSDIYINLIKRNIQLLLDEDCRVILVFDGQPLPAKKDTNEKRLQSRARNLELGLICQANGDRKQAFKHFQASAGITPDIIEHAIEEFRTIVNVDIIVAPYEADAQLAYLIKRGIADAVVTEDSDLIPFGCETIIFKLKEDSSCVIYERKLLHKCVNRGLASKFNFDVFRRICIMSGCDYFPDGIPKVGLKKSVDVFTKSIFAPDFSQIVKLLKRVPRYLDLKKVTVTDKMIRAFIEAEYTFLHQIIFDPITRSQIPLSDHSTVPPDVAAFLKNKKDPYWFAGKPLSAEDAFRRAIGNFNLKGADKFKMDNPPTWSIYHPDRLKNLHEVEPSLQFIDSGYASNNSQPEDDTIVPGTPDDPFRDSPGPEEVELLKKLSDLNRISAERSKRVSVNISSTPSTPMETFGVSLNKPTDVKGTKDGFVPPAPEEPCTEKSSLNQSVVMSAQDNDAANHSTACNQDENAPPAATPGPSADLPLKTPTPIKKEMPAKKSFGPARPFGFKTPTSVKRKVEVVTVGSRQGPSPQTNEIFKPRSSFNFNPSRPKPQASLSSMISPRGIKRPLSEISGNEASNRSTAKPDPSAAKPDPSTPFIRSVRAPQKPSSVKSVKSKSRISLSPRLYKNAFPSVEFPKKQ